MNINVKTEYRDLLRGTIRTPSGLSVGEPINLVQAFYFSSRPPDAPIVQRQHQAFEKVLISAGIQLDTLPPTGSPFQLFTRDIGFAIGKRFFVASMKVEVRRQETISLKAWLDKMGVPAADCTTSSIEGGDILVDYPYVYVGIGERTSEKAATRLADELQDPWRIIQVHTNPRVLHLDCVLCIIARDTIIYCPSLIGKGREAIEERYPQRIIVSEQEVFNMACNVLSLDESTLMVEAGQPRLQRALREMGFRIETVDWSEIRKFGGLFRCAICPLEREP